MRYKSQGAPPPTAATRKFNETSSQVSRDPGVDGSIERGLYIRESGILSSLVGFG